MKKSFFGKYFMYKLRVFRGLAIAAAVLNCAALLLPAVDFFNKFADAANHNDYYIPDNGDSMFITFAAAAAMMVIIAITPVLSFKYYNNRAAIDTLGCLPLSYRERFFGDFLSGLAANLITFIPFSIIGAAIVAAIQNTYLKQLQELCRAHGYSYVIESVNDELLKVYAGFAIMLFLEYIGTYVISTFVTSCCGRAGSSILYSVITLIVPAGIVSTYGSCVLGGAVGVTAYNEIKNALMAIPPTGMLMSTILECIFSSGFYYSDGFLLTMTYIVRKPVYIAIALLITAAFFVGAYYLGKYRKTERVDRDFVYNRAYQVIALALSAAIIGFYFNAHSENSAAYKNGDLYHIVFSAAVGLAIYIVMELVHLRSAKKLPMSLLRYAGLYAVCFAFLFVSYRTGGFGIEKHLPDKDKISYVEIEGTEFYTPNLDPFVYGSEKAIDTIYSGHEKLIQNRDILTTGGTVSLNYVMSNGTELHRQYSSDNDAGKELIKSFCADIRENEPESGLGFIGDMRYDRVLAITFHNHRTDVTLSVKPEVCDDLAAALKYDLLHYGSELQTGSIGYVAFVYEQGGVEKRETYMVNEAFKGTLAEITKNTTNDTTVFEEEEYSYYISYLPDPNEQTPVISSVSLELKNTDERASAKTVMKYIAATNDIPEEERSERWQIQTVSRYNDFCVRRSDDDAMLKAVLDLAADIAE